MRVMFRNMAAFGIAAALCVSLGAQSSRPTVAVLNFDFGSVQHWWNGNQDIGPASQTCSSIHW